MARAAHGHGRSRAGRGNRTPHRAFAVRLARLRAEAGLTQTQLADRLGASRRQVAYYESGRGRPPGALLGLLADLFRISTDSLLGREGGARPPRLSSGVLARLRAIERFGADAGRRLEAVLDEFIVAEEWRRQPARARRAGAAARAGGARRAAGLRH